MLEGTGFRACSAGIQQPEQTLLVVFVNGLLTAAVQVALLLTLHTCIIICCFQLIYHRINVICCLLSSATNENGTPRKQDVSAAGQKKIQTNVRVLRGHSGAITALHCVTRREVWDLVGDREDAGFFISGSTDCCVSVHI